MQSPPKPRPTLLLSMEEDTLHIPHPAATVPLVAEADRPRLAALADQALRQGLTHFRQGRYPVALEQFHHALSNYQQAADQPNTAKVLMVLSSAYYRLADYLWAADYGRQCLLLAQKIQHQPLQQQVLEHLGNSYRHLGNLQAALDHMGKSLQLAKELHDSQAEMRALNNLAMIYRVKGLNRQAATLYEASWLMAKTLGDTTVQLQVLQNLGNTYHTLHHYAQAIECYEKFLQLNEATPTAVASHQTTRRILTQLTRASLAIHDYSRAIIYLQRHLALACTLGDSKGATALIDDLSQCYLALNQVRAFQVPDPMISDSMVSV
ncbi:tetratricopeptide repeat protein [Phormidium sp. FACHB-1136]|uniref:tetratricopeptide repeat protein n=1 Tax=Phormidium sp. FACHB-1136 TaxID=2692848 RepID=UPI0016843182|nr:tetratricopeptide repeat protein [Phormidium sp. FACHB-1136]MBD2426704.1 tetratricopeptide repeat protein [Phormidium sp. FACHB-1136]